MAQIGTTDGTKNWHRNATPDMGPESATNYYESPSVTLRIRGRIPALLLEPMADAELDSPSA